MAAPDQRVPELIGGVDIRTLPLTAIDGFVLSRIDGRANVSDIVAMTGLSGAQVHEIVGRLVELGAARWKGEPDPSQAGSSLPPRAPRTPPPRLTSMPPSPSSSAPRRRPSWGQPQPRRVFAESSISSPPPDVRGLSQRPRSVSPGGTARVRTPPPRTPPPSVPGGRESLEPPPMPGYGGSERVPRESQEVPRTPAPESDPAQAHTPLATPRTMPLRGPTPLYDLRELDEEVDLPRERRKQILDLYYRLSSLDYYQVLGVDYSADRKQIRAAYFSLSKAFHPDSMFRKELGSFKAKMTEVFKQLTEAYETLGKNKTREEYDAYLRSTRSIADAERALSVEATMEVPRPPPLPSTDYAVPAPTPLPPSREPSAEARRLAREVLERRLRGIAPPSSRRAPAPASESAGAGQQPEDSTAARQELAKQLTRTLIDAGKVSGSSDKVTRAVNLAKNAFERGDLTAAVQHMAGAMALAPERTDLRAEHERLSRIVAEKLAEDYAEHARFEAKQGKWASAAVSWARVCEGRPSDAQAHRAAAFALMKAGGDLRGAQKYAQQAVFLAPDDIDARILLAQIHLTVGLKLNARRELDAAAKLDPDNEMVKNLLSELKA